MIFPNQIKMNDYQYLKLAKKTIKDCLAIKKEFLSKKITNKLDIYIKKELKTNLDTKLEQFIINALKFTKINILVEESGLIKISIANNTRYMWIIDPLDGTYNYLRKLGPSTISISLWKDDKPLFGVLGLFPEMKVVFGGKSIGSFVNKNKLKISNRSAYSVSTLHTGFPSRYIFTNNNLKIFNEITKKFMKIRMIGSGSYSLYMLACGNSDYYYENNIMLWDVAAGLSILEGAGGKFKLTKNKKKYLCTVHATNKKLKLI